MNEIEKIYWEIMRSEVFRLDGPSIDLPDALRRLAAAIAEHTEDTDWSLGEHEEADLASLIIGAYWALSAWHAGQASGSYAALCALGRVFSPGMTDGPEPESSEVNAYQMVADWFESKPDSSAL